MSDESTEDQPGPSSSLSSSITESPKKGILKRPSIRSQPAGGRSEEQALPPPGHRPSPDRFPDKPGTRIPKLSVTWWEKNAVAIFGDTSDENNTDSEQVLKDLGSGPRGTATAATLRQTAILDSEEDSEHAAGTSGSRQRADRAESVDEFVDDAMSVASTGSATSSVVGRWWTGKDTRYVPHCQKRGCNHLNHAGELGEYLTPTQRRNKEMNELKKELKDAIGERDEKDRHLIELRERIKEIELLNNVQSTLSDGHRLMQREREGREQLEKDRRALEKKHAIRVNQLVQETLQAREEISRLTSRINELEDILSRPRVEVSTMTEPVQYSVPNIPFPPAPMSPTAPTDPSSFSQVRSPPLSPVVTTPLSPVHSLPEQSAFQSPFPISSPMSVSVDSKQPMYLSQEAINHMQACQNEAFIWRTKAAQLEIVVKEQLLKSSQIEQSLKAELQAARNDSDMVRRMAGMAPVVSQPEETVSRMQDSGIENTSTTCSPQHKVSEQPMECVNISCIERKKKLIEENNQLLETIEDVNMRIRELEEDVTAIRIEYDRLEDQSNSTKSKLEEASRLVDSKTAEIAAGNIVISRLQTEKETMQKAISYMEERMQVYQNTLMEHDLIVSDESIENWRKGFGDPRYSVMVSKRVQTEMTAEALTKHEDEFQITKRKLEELHTEFSANRSDLHGRFEEIEKILLTKTHLVEMLSKQLEDTRRDQRSEIESHQSERERYKQSLSEITTVAERVPVLETRIEDLLQEQSEFENRLKQQKEEYEDSLEGALEEAMKKYKEQSDYWKDKMHQMELQLSRSKNETSQQLREREEQKMKWQLERAELERKLTSSIDHVSLLNTQMNKPRRDVECEARPRHVSKYVACRPNVKSKSTVIEKGDLFDESEERLKLCQGELATTRRQVHVLQQKLISSIQSTATDHKKVQIRRRIACVVDRPVEEEKTVPEEESVEKLDSLHARNIELREKLSQVEDEKASLVRNERERIQHLATEFDNVRKELDQEMCRYESEKKWLKSRIRNLEKDNEELQRQLEKSSTPPSVTDASRSGVAAADGQLPRIAIEEDRQSNLRKTLSEPELGMEDEEMSKLRAENVRLISELDRVRDSIRRTASGASAASRATARSQLSPAFANLADDLNMVKSDLEQILTSMDEDEPARAASRAALRSSRTPLKEEDHVQSEILDKVMADWEEDEKEHLARDLKRSRQERDSMKVRLERISNELRCTRAELEVFRRETTEPREGTESQSGEGGRLRKSRSVVDLVGADGDKQENRRWKEKCGTMFRELQSMRSGYAAAMEERRDLRIQVAMLRGELELARCQPTRTGEPSMTSSAYFSPKSTRSEATSRSYHSALEGPSRRDSEDVIVHESPAVFRRGSTREAVVCNIISASDTQAPSPGRREQSRERPADREARERTRSRSAGQRRRGNTTSKEEFEAMEQRRRSRKSLSTHAAVTHSVSSSMTSLLDPGTSSPRTHLLSHKPPLPCAMSQSWHEGDIQRSIENLDGAVRELESVGGGTGERAAMAAGGDHSRSQSRVVSLREKVGRLSRENKLLHEELAKWKKRAGSTDGQPLVAATRNALDADRLNRLEEEKELLKEQVEQLLYKIQQEESAAAAAAPASPDRDQMYLEERLTLSRQENEMYERKIAELEEERREMYLVMFKKGQQAATMDMKEAQKVDQMTQDRVVLKFLHDAFYYFLMNKGDAKEHLQAMMTMLDFSSQQKEDVAKRRGKSH